MANKMTKVEMFNEVIALANGEATKASASDIVAFCNHEIFLLKAKAKKKIEKASTADDELKAAVVATLSNMGAPATVTAVMNASPAFEGYTNQKISAVLRKLVADGVVVNTKDKKGSYFALVSEPTEETSEE